MMKCVLIRALWVAAAVSLGWQARDLRHMLRFSADEDSFWAWTNSWQADEAAVQHYMDSAAGPREWPMVVDWGGVVTCSNGSVNMSELCPTPIGAWLSEQLCDTEVCAVERLPDWSLGERYAVTLTDGSRLGLYVSGGVVDRVVAVTIPWLTKFQFRVPPYDDQDTWGRLQCDQGSAYWCDYVDRMSGR